MNDGLQAKAGPACMISHVAVGFNHQTRQPHAAAVRHTVHASEAPQRDCMYNSDVKACTELLLGLHYHKLHVAVGGVGGGTPSDG